jgi:hypothetical protein
MPDHAADPVWDADTGGMVQLGGLPLSAPTTEALRDWRRRWEVLALDDAEDPRSWAVLDRDGQRLWEQVREELGPAYEVGYDATVASDGERLRVRWAPGADPEVPAWLAR